MIRIDHLSFEFAMDDERFAQRLYADWDSFCRTCVEDIVEECFSAYDKDRVLHEVEKLDLDLGSIPQEDFHTEFPRRLRGELLKALPSFQLGEAGKEEAKTEALRFANLLYYLEHGVLKTEWADIEFNLSAELDDVTRLDKRYLEKIAGLCMANEYVLRRILLQTNREASLVHLYSTAMDRMFFVEDGKRRFMEIFLEMQPDVPLSFVHGTEEDGRLHGMAELLGTRSVRRIMEKETAEHAEVDLPPYWHYLYEWLIKYYPYNGIAIFGGKSDFIGHLHYRLLTFIHKRNSMFYLSKAELTAAFLLEVFGAAYYKAVLNAIYNMQPRNADGSPAYDGYYNLQLYRIFMQLSLLSLPLGINVSRDESVFKGKDSSLLTDLRMEDLSVVLKDTGRSEADKRMAVAALVRQKPEELIAWLKTEATDDDALMTILVRLIDERALKRLLASTSLTAMETVNEVIRYLTGFVREGRLSDGLTYESFAFASRKAVLLWIKGNGYALSAIEGIKSLLHLIYKEIVVTTGKNSDMMVEGWMQELQLLEDGMEGFQLLEEETEELHLLENETKDFGTFVGQEDDIIKESIRRLRILLNAGNISETVKRRLTVLFLERHKDRIADAIKELHEQGLLENVIKRISVSAAETVIRQMITHYIGTSEAEKLLLLIDRLFAGENTISAYLQDKSLTLKMQVLVWLAQGIKTQEIKKQPGIARPFPELCSLFLTSLFGKENVSAVIRRVLYSMAGEMITTEMKDDDILEVMELLPYIDNSRVHRALSVFEQWSQQIKTYSNTVQTLLKSPWNTSGGFTEWLEDAEVATESKRELLQALAREKPQELTMILRDLPQDEKTVSFIATYIPAEMLLDGIEKADAKQALLLSRTMDFLQRERGRFTFLSNMTLSFTTALSEALLLFMQDKETLNGRNLTEQEVVGKFLEHLYYVYTRRRDYNDNKEWKHLQNEVTDGLDLDGTGLTSASVSEDAVSERLLSEYGSLNDSELYHLAAGVLDKEPEQFVKLLEKNPDPNFIRRISDIADRTMFRRLVTVLSSISGFENHTAFIRWMEWLGTRSASRMPVSDMMSILLSWISTTDWKRQSTRQMTVFFLSRLYDSNDAASVPLEMLTDDALPEEIRKRLLHNYMHSCPADLLEHIQRLAAQGKSPMNKWTEWANLSEWLQLAASVSLTLEELLRQIIEYLLSQSKTMNDETALKRSLATFIATNDAARFAYYVDKKEVARSFVLSLPAMQEKTAEEKEEAVSQVMESLGITPEEETILEGSQEDELEVALVSNAGLCLLSPWFPRLFAMLSYLDEEKRNFKDTASRIRALFLLQYLANPEEKNYREPELAFNRLLVALPIHVPLPKQIELTEEEKRTADSMLEGVKANWIKMNGTSVNGFRQSFIMRDGRLEQQDEKWLLTVESRVIDILLDTVPWAFRQIRFPWLKKHIQISWHEKQDF